MITNRQLITITDPDLCDGLLRSKGLKMADMSHLLDAVSRLTGRTLEYLRNYACTSPFNLNGDAHLKLKQMLAGYYSASRLKLWLPEIIGITDRWLDRLAENDDVDLLQNFINPVTAHISYFTLGLKPEVHEESQPLVCSLLRLTDLEYPLKIRDLLGLDSDAQGLHSLIERNLTYSASDEAPSDCCNDFFHYMLDQYQLSEAEVITYMMILLAAGISTQHTLANMLVELLRYTPEQRHDLIKSQSAAQVIERLLYSTGGVKTLYRFVDQASQLLPENAQRGDLVAIEIAEASCQAVASVCPFAPDSPVSRKYNFAFGKGVHKCIGESLSRMTLEYCVLAFFKRFPLAIAVEPMPERFYTSSCNHPLSVSLQHQ